MPLGMDRVALGVLTHSRVVRLGAVALAQQVEDVGQVVAQEGLAAGERDVEHAQVGDLAQRLEDLLVAAPHAALGLDRAGAGGILHVVPVIPQPGYQLGVGWNTAGLDNRQRLRRYDAALAAQIEEEQRIMRLRASREYGAWLGAIQSQVQRNQREFYLNEQLRAIRKELGYQNEFAGEMEEVERFAMGKRIREVEQGPEGAIWVLEDRSGGRLLKLTKS